MKSHKYKNYCSEEMILRDHLAYDRTFLANERTFLSYERTAIMVFATGLTLVKLFSNNDGLVLLGFIVIGISILVAILGLFKYLILRRDLKQIYEKQKGIRPE